MRRYLNIDEVKRIHFALIEQYGGSHGVRDTDSLESAVMRPQSGYYDDIISEALALMESLAINHPFVDGNKRVALGACETFLILNGLEISMPSEELYDGMIQLFETQNFKHHALETLLRVHIKPYKNE